MVATKKKRSRPVAKPKPQRPGYVATLRKLLADAYTERDAARAAAQAFQKEAEHAKAETFKWRTFDQYDLPTVRKQRDDCYARIAELARMVEDANAAEARAADRADSWERVAAAVVKNASESSGVLHPEEVTAMVHAAMKAERLTDAVDP